MIDQMQAVASETGAMAWQWDGWSRAADLATIVTALGTASFVSSMFLARWSQIWKIESYLKDVGRRKGPEEQGLRSAENISRKLDIPVDDVKRLAHASRHIVSRIRRHGPDQVDTFMWGHRRFIREKA